MGLKIAAGMHLAVAAHCRRGLSIARPDSQLEDGGGGLHIFCRDRNLYPSGCGSTGTDYYYGSMRCVMETSGGYFLVQISPDEWQPIAHKLVRFLASLRFPPLARTARDEPRLIAAVPEFSNNPVARQGWQAYLWLAHTSWMQPSYVLREDSANCVSLKPTTRQDETTGVEVPSLVDGEFDGRRRLGPTAKRTPGNISASATLIISSIQPTMSRTGSRADHWTSLDGTALIGMNPFSPPPLAPNPRILHW